MSRRIGLLASFLVLAGSGFWLVSGVLALGDPLTEGAVIKTEEEPDGSTDIYRAQADGRIVVEHRGANGDVWFENNEVVGHDGKPVICPNGEPLRIDITQVPHEPTPDEVREAQRGLPDDKRAVYNQHSGEFEVIDAVSQASAHGEITASEPLFYQCDASNQPILVPLSTIDPEAAERARRQMEELAGNDGLTGLGSDPAASAPATPARP